MLGSHWIEGAPTSNPVNQSKVLELSCAVKHLAKVQHKIQKVKRKAGVCISEFWVMLVHGPHFESQAFDRTFEVQNPESSPKFSDP